MASSAAFENAWASTSIARVTAPLPSTFTRAFFRDETGVAEILDSDPGQTSSGCERLESVEIDCLVFNAG